MTTFNLNNKVRVRLTDHGRAALMTDHVLFWAKAGRSMPYTPPKEDADGWSEWQLWRLMSALGNHIGVGLENVIETNIELEPFDRNSDQQPTMGAGPSA